MTAAQDFSQIHQMAGSLFDAHCRASERSQWMLNDRQMDFYRENGFVIGPRILNDCQVAALRDELAELSVPDHRGSDYWYEYNSNESRDPARVLFHALGAWRLRPGLHDILWHAPFTTVAAQVLGGAVRFWHDQLFCKPAMHGGVVAWHQDYSYWTRTHPMNHLTCWIGLDDSTVKNGCVYYVPGSHLWNLLPVTGLAGDMNAIRDVLNDEQWAKFQHPVAAEIPAGHCLLHHPLTIHGSFENTTPNPRRAVVLNVVRDGVTSASDQPLLEGVPVIPPGQPLGGQFFPLLYDPAAASQ